MRDSILKLPEYLFWDTDFEKIDPDKQYLAVISRVFDYGSWEDVLEVMAYYGEKKVKKSLKRVTGLRERSVCLAISLFKLKLKDFKCYSNNPSRPTFW